MDYYSQPQFRGGILLSEMSAPATPSGATALFAGTDGYLYVKNDNGDVYGVAPPPQQFNQAANTDFTSTTFLPYTGGPSLDVLVPASGCVELIYGFVGTVNSDVQFAQAWIDVAFTAGANIRTDTTNEVNGISGSGVVMFGRGTNNDLSVERNIVFTGLNPGLTTMELWGRYSGSSNNTIRESWLIAKVHP